MKRVVLIFLKYPTPGRVKTRLAADLGEEAAAEAYRKMVARVFEQCRRASPDVIAICYDPPSEAPAVRRWLQPLVAAYTGEVLWIPQSSGDLGDRLENGTAAVFGKFPEAQVVVMGTDCVGLDSAVFSEVWSVTGKSSDVVFGPTGDGGYYLVAMAENTPELFQGIEWSSEKTLEDSLSAAGKAGLTTHLLPERTDIDTVSEWKKFEEKVSRRPCVFFDRDGVINRSPGPGYVLRWEDFHLNAEIAEAVKIARSKGYLAIIATSQRGVGKGLMSQGDLDRIHRNLQLELGKTGSEFDGIYAYTETPDCTLRPKPDPAMLHSAAADIFIDLSQSWMIGDADRDIEMGQNAGVKGTIRVEGDNEIGVSADHTISSIAELPELVKKLL